VMIRDQQAGCSGGVALALAAAFALGGCHEDSGDTGDTAPPPAASVPAASDSGAMPPGAATTPATAPTAVAVRAITLGTSAGADDKIATPMTTLASNDPVVVSVETDGATSSATLTVKLVSADGQTAAERSRTITTTGMDTTNVTFSPGNGWPTGSYRVEVWINDTLARSTDFTVS